jgi:Flp pilus assembly pilin Flp
MKGDASFQHLVREEGGQTLTEYALILGFCSIGTMLLLSGIGNEVVTLLTGVASKF